MILILWLLDLAEVVASGEKSWWPFLLSVAITAAIVIGVNLAEG